jgi:hypothetical protein
MVLNVKKLLFLTNKLIIMNDLTNNLLVNSIEKTETYEAPQIEVIEVEVEQGFQASGPSRPGTPSW